MTAFVPFDLKELADRGPGDSRRGIVSICSAHPWVLEAAMERVRGGNDPLLIEATCNQVNQFGGYTGMTPQSFRDHVWSIAARTRFPVERIILGGDHLGPYPWRGLPAEQAMENASDLVGAFVAAGFTKIHLDASMSCKGDPVPLADSVIAARAAKLASAAESAARDKNELRYVVGTEVPVPGGALEHLTVHVTRQSDAEDSLLLHKAAFEAAGVGDAWEKVIALVTQPGVEFGHEDVVHYDRPKARFLKNLLQRYSQIVFEAHSTDYQKPKAYRELIEDGFAILKVGPALTYAMREAVFALVAIEQILLPEHEWSRLDNVLMHTMQEHPEHWKEHYTGSDLEIRRMLIHSYSDRIRYYWTVPEVESALARLLANLEQAKIPETLLSDYLPKQYERVRNGELANRPVALIKDKVSEALDPYIRACSISA